MKIDVFPPEGSIEDIRGQVQDAIATALQGVIGTEPDEAKKIVIQEQIIEILKPMARKIGGETAMTPWVYVDSKTDQAQGHVDLSIRFYFTAKPE